MSDTQNLTKPDFPKGVPIATTAFELLPLAQQMWIDYTALGGLITEADGQPHKMKVADFADKIGYSRETLYSWRNSIPNFWELVTERCEKLFNETRTIKVINAWYLGATIKLNPQLIAMWMANQKRHEFRMPQQNVTHEAGNSWAALLDGKRNTDKVVEGEVVDDKVA